MGEGGETKGGIEGFHCTCIRSVRDMMLSLLERSDMSVRDIDIIMSLRLVSLSRLAYGLL